MDKDLIVISVGGSLIVPEGIDTNFLKGFRDLILKYIKKGKRFVIVCGGGKTARKYQEAGKFFELKEEDVDWLGIDGTIINAHLLRAIFSEWAHSRVINNPTERIDFKEKILVASGWKPGFSTDFDAVLLAKNFEAKKLVNLTNIDYVYDKDPKKFKDVKPIRQIPWNEFRKIMPDGWDPGLNVPFDPVASREAQKLQLEVAIINGKDMENIENYLEGKDFIGTRIKT
jgi:uridylate kinase